MTISTRDASHARRGRVLAAARFFFLWRGCVLLSRLFQKKTEVLDALLTFRALHIFILVGYSSARIRSIELFVLQVELSYGRFGQKLPEECNRSKHALYPVTRPERGVGRLQGTICEGCRRLRRRVGLDGATRRQIAPFVSQFGPQPSYFSVVSRFLYEGHPGVTHPPPSRGTHEKIRPVLSSSRQGEK